MKISLFIKPSLLRAYIFVLIMVSFFCQANSVSAGFLSDLVDKIVGNKTQVPEVVPINNDVVHNSQNIPLLESSINPDIKNIKDDPIPTLSNDTLLSNNGSLGMDSDLEKYASSAKITVYKVKKGDTLDSIAKKLKIPKSTILSSNADIKKSELLKIGQTLVILAIKEPVKSDKVDINKEKVIAKKDVQEKIIRKEDVSAPKEEIKKEPVISIPIVEVLPSPAVAEPQSKELIPETPSTPTGQPEGTINGGYIWPLPDGIGRVSQGLHADQAYDFAAPKGTPIYAVQDGTVLIAHNKGYNGGYGLYVVINFNDGRQAIFGHMSKVASDVGQVVKRGDIIGYVGNTGHSTGSHVHIGFHVGDDFVVSPTNPINPYKGLKVNSTDLIEND